MANKNEKHNQNKPWYGEKVYEEYKIMEYTVQVI